MHRWLAVKAAGLDAWLVLSIENDQGAGLRICKWRGVEVIALGRLKCKECILMQLVWGAIP